MTKHGVDDGDDCISRVPLPQMCSHKRQNPGMVWVGIGSKDHLIPTFLPWMPLTTSDCSKCHPTLILKRTNHSCERLRNISALSQAFSIAILEKEETNMKELLVFHLKTLLEQCTGNHQDIYRNFILLVVDKTDVFNYDSGQLNMMR